MPSEPGAGGAATPPPDPLDEMWYVQGSAKALGPYRGHDLEAMIERGSIGAQTWVAKVGATQWSMLAEIPAFAGLGALRAVHYAGFWIRVLAYIVDQLIIWLIVFPVSLVIGLAYGVAGAGQPGGGLPAALSVVVFLVEIAIIIVYQMISLSSRWQATPGKRVCGIHVIRTDGRKIGRGLALGRYLSTFISGVVLYIGFIMVAFMDQKQGLHDLICSTRVIYGKAEDTSQIAEIFA